MRGNAFTRQLRLLQLLESRPGGLEIEEAAEALGRGRRTVYRDFEVLEGAGIPLVADKDGSRARWRMMEGYRHRLQLSLSWSEVLALSTGSRLMAGLAGTLFHEGAVSALEKIRATLPKALFERVKAAEEAVSALAGGHDYRARSRLLATIVEAVEQRRTIVAHYRSRSRAKAKAKAQRERKIDPYHLRVAEQGVYIIGRCHRANEARTFLLDRFDDVHLGDETFSVPVSFRPDRYLADAFAMFAGPPREVRFVVGGTAGELLLERKLHPSQVAQQRRLGAGTAVEVRLRIPIVPPLVAYLCGLGPDVWEISPAELADEVRRRHEAALEVPSRGSRGNRRTG